MRRTRQIGCGCGRGPFYARDWDSSAAAVVEFRSADVAEVKDGIRILWPRGHSVINDQNEMIGTIDEFVVGDDLTLFVILQVGEFLDLKEHLIALPRRSSMTLCSGSGSGSGAQPERRSETSQNSAFAGQPEAR